MASINGVRFPWPGRLYASDMAPMRGAINIAENGPIARKKPTTSSGNSELITVIAGHFDVFPCSWEMIEAQ